MLVKSMLVEAHEDDNTPSLSRGRNAYATLPSTCGIMPFFNSPMAVTLS